MSKYAVIIALIIAAVALSSCSFSLAEDITPPPGSQQSAFEQATQSLSNSPVYPIVPPDLANGARIYQQNCAQCHGDSGLGDGPQAAQLSVPVASLGLSDFARQYSPAQWYTTVTKGNMEKLMPSFGSLTDRQRWDVVAYAISMSTPPEEVSRGQALYRENCESCHGRDGRGNGPNAAGLSTQPTDFTDQSFMADTPSQVLFDGITSGIQPDMPAYSSTLDTNQRYSLVSYLRSLSYTLPVNTAGSYPPPVANVSASATRYPYPAPQANIDPQSAVTEVPTTSIEISPTETFVGSVSVHLINGSGGDVPSGAPVTLYGFDNMQNTYSDTLTTGANGVYVFPNVVMPSGRAFLAGVTYANATYGSDIAVVDPNTPDLSLDITIYDNSTDASALTTDRAHLLFDFSSPDFVQVVEVFIISNPTTQTIVAPAEGGAVVTFPLPKGYTNLEFQDGSLGSRYLEVSQGFADTTSVNPGQGQYQVIFAYRLPYNRKLEFVQPMFLPTSAVVVLVPDNGVKVTSSMLKDGGTRDYQNTTYRMYNGENLIAGSSLEFTLSGTPRKSAGSVFTGSTMQNLAIGLAFFGVALVLTGLLLYRRYQRKAALTGYTSVDLAAPVSDGNATPEDADTLMDAIIALDDQYHAGNLPKEAYLERRAALKEKLRNLEQAGAGSAGGM